MKGLGLFIGENERKPLDLHKNGQILIEERREAAICSSYYLKK